MLSGIYSARLSGIPTAVLFLLSSQGCLLPVCTAPSTAPPSVLTWLLHAYACQNLTCDKISRESYREFSR